MAAASEFAMQVAQGRDRDDHSQHVFHGTATEQLVILKGFVEDLSRQIHH